MNTKIDIETNSEEWEIPAPKTPAQKEALAWLKRTIQRKRASAQNSAEFNRFDRALRRLPAAVPANARPRQNRRIGKFLTH